MNIFSKILTLWIYLTNHKVPSQQRWFIRFRYFGLFHQLKYFIKDYIIKKPYKIIHFEGEFQQELLHVIPFAYWHYKNGTLLKTISSSFTKHLYFFSPNHEEDTTIVRGYLGNESLEIPNAPHDVKLLKLKWKQVPFKQKYSNEIFKFEKEVLVIANRYNTEWGKPPISYFSIENLESLFLHFKDKYQIIYNRAPASKISNDNSEVLELNDEHFIKSKFPEIIYLPDLEKVNLSIIDYNHLQLLVYANCSKFISIHGGTATLASLFGGVNYIYSKEGHEHSLKEFENVFSELSNTNIKKNVCIETLIETVKNEL